MDNPPPATMMLISNDEVPFHENLYEFEACGYKVIRSYPSPDKSSQDIRWKSIVEGKCFGISSLSFIQIRTIELVSVFLFFIFYFFLFSHRDTGYDDG